MKRIPDGSVDAIICDLPYGTMKGSWKGLDEYDPNKHEWDNIIPTAPLFEQYERVLRKGGVAVLFSQEPYTSHLRTFHAKNMAFLYPMFWKKDSFGMSLNAKTAPLSFIEDINVFAKANPLYDYELKHPLREYSQKVLDFIGMSCRDIEKDLKAKGIPEPTSVQHFLSVKSVEFRLCQRKTYKLLIEQYGIDNMEGFKSYEECEEIWLSFNRVKTNNRTFNLPEGQSFLSNVLEFAKDTDGFHPTQKPVALIRRLVLTYTNDGDTVLDNCMGSGTTAIACIKEKRRFIGFELSKEYYDKACKRIKAEQAQLTLF